MSRMDRVTTTNVDLRLARDGGSPARSRPERPMFPGGMELGDEEAEAAARVIRSHNVFRYYGVGDGPHEVVDFEREFAAHMGAKHALCVNAGSSALICGLIGAGVGPGDEVIVPAYTWNATANAVIASRAHPRPRGGRRVADARSGRRERKLTSAHEGDPSGAHARRSGRHGRADRARVRARPGDDRGRLPGGRGDLPRLAPRHVRRRGSVQPAVQQDHHDRRGRRDDHRPRRSSASSRSTSTTARAGARRGAGLPQFAGWNFRASEIQGAVARVQLTRLDGLLERMRANQAGLAERVGRLPGLTLRRPNDDGGDAGICLIAFAESSALAAEAVAGAARGGRRGDADL